jgi:hypothetical protein
LKSIYEQGPILRSLHLQLKHWRHSRLERFSKAKKNILVLQNILFGNCLLDYIYAVSFYSLGVVAHDQGDQIGRISTQGAIAYFGQFSEN